MYSSAHLVCLWSTCKFHSDRKKMKKKCLCWSLHHIVQQCAVAGEDMMMTATFAAGTHGWVTLQILFVNESCTGCRWVCRMWGDSERAWTFCGGNEEAWNWWYGACDGRSMVLSFFLSFFWEVFATAEKFCFADGMIHSFFLEELFITKQLWCIAAFSNSIMEFREEMDTYSCWLQAMDMELTNLFCGWLPWGTYHLQVCRLLWRRRCSKSKVSKASSVLQNTRCLSPWEWVCTASGGHPCAGGYAANEGLQLGLLFVSMVWLLRLSWCSKLLCLLPPPPPLQSKSSKYMRSTSELM